MKNKFKILSFLFAISLIISPVLLNGQNNPPKGATRIILTDTLSKEQNFKLIVTKLIDDGWQIASKDLEYGTIETKPKKLNKDSFETIYNFVVKDFQVTLSGKLNNNIDFTYSGVMKINSEWQDIYYSSNFYIFRPAFEKMIGFATNLKPFNIDYK